jgi:hypothetical protein
MDRQLRDITRKKKKKGEKKKDNQGSPERVPCGNEVDRKYIMPVSCKFFYKTFVAQCFLQPNDKVPYKV